MNLVLKQINLTNGKQWGTLSKDKLAKTSRKINAKYLDVQGHGEF